MKIRGLGFEAMTNLMEVPVSIYLRWEEWSLKLIELPSIYKMLVVTNVLSNYLF